MWIALCNMTFLNVCSVQFIIVPFKLVAALLIDSWDTNGKTPESEMRTKLRVTIESTST